MEIERAYAHNLQKHLKATPIIHLVIVQSILQLIAAPLSIVLLGVELKRLGLSLFRNLLSLNEEPMFLLFLGVSSQKSRKARLSIISA